MSESLHSINELASAAAFNNQASVFDLLFSTDILIQYKRERVRNHVNRFIKANSSILELNAGTGEDAIYFARQGHCVHATDIAEGMLEVLAGKVKKSGLTDKITHETCSYTLLDSLKNKGPYDFIFSNFAGLNCTAELEKVLGSFTSLLKPGGTVTLVMLPKFCLWETLMLFKGKVKTAFRRISTRNGVQAHIEGVYFKCWYYNPSYIRECLKTDFDLLSIEGLCVVVPPSYIEGFTEKYPRLYQYLRKKEDKLKDRWPWKYIGDYFILSLKKKI